MSISYLHIIECVNNPFEDGISCTTTAPDVFQASTSSACGSSSTNVKKEPFDDGYSDVDYDSLLQQFGMSLLRMDIFARQLRILK